MSKPSIDQTPLGHTQGRIIMSHTLTTYTGDIEYECFGGNKKRMTIIYSFVELKKTYLREI
jgi:hypothetical protein